MQSYLTANYHTHTTRCKHARGTEREYIERAIEMGMKTLGFSDHIPCAFSEGYSSGVRMDLGQEKEYLATMRKLQEEYKDRIKIFVGFEAEYVPEFWQQQLEMFRNLGFDYMIMGQHFLNSEEIGPYTGMPTTDEDFLIKYVDQVLEGMRTGYFAYIAHPDIINYQGPEEIFNREIERLCRGLKELEIPLEINLLGVHEGKHYPSDRFWKIVGEVGNDVILGIDAHWPELIGDVKDYEDGVAFAKKHGLHLIEDLPKTKFFNK